MRCRAAAAAGLVLLAAGAARAEPLVYATAAPVLGLDPHINNERITTIAKLAVYEGLVHRRPDLVLEPALAVGWEQVDAVTWRFHLRADVAFHDGRPLSAADVVFSAERAAQPESEMAWTASSIADIRAVDPLTVEISTGDQPRPTLLSELAYLFVMNRDWAENHAAATVVRGAGVHSFANLTANGTGPFRAETDPETGETHLSAHGDWWGWSGDPGVAAVTLRPIADADARIEALRAGTVDMVEPVPPAAVAGLEADPAITVHRTAGLRVLFLGLDQRGEQSLFADRRVRAAVARAIDRPRLVAQAGGEGVVPADRLIAPAVVDIDDEGVPAPDHDPAAARRLLRSAGVAGDLHPVLDCPEGRYVHDVTLCRSVVDMLQAVGIRASLRLRPPVAHLQAIGRGAACESDLYLLGWLPARFDAAAPIAELLTADGGAGTARWNCAGYRNEAVAALARRIAVEYDPAARDGLIREALGLARADGALIPLVREVRLWATGPRVDQAALHPAGDVALRALVEVR